VIGTQQYREMESSCASAPQAREQDKKGNQNPGQERVLVEDQKVAYRTGQEMAEFFYEIQTKVLKRESDTRF
jgi:hypothetical protein